MYWIPVIRGSYEITIACLSFTSLVSSTFFMNCLLAFPGFFHSSSLARCQRTQDQYLTVNVVEPHKLSKIFCITIAHNSKKARQLKSVKSL